jgi:hypothetical protein
VARRRPSSVVLGGKGVITTGFGFSWFTKKLFAERRLMKDIVVAALTMHLIALSVSIFFQLLVDKVIPNQAFSTLYALSAGVGVLILFDAGFNYLRNYLLAFITRRLDHQVATGTIEHLLPLPIHYFHANPSGVVAYKLQEANNVRDFLASRLFNSVLDFLALIIYLPVLLIYSWRLTLIVLGIAAIAFALLAAMSRTFRRQLNEVNEIEGRRKAFLFEILSGMATIKTLALEVAPRPAGSVLKEAETLMRLVPTSAVLLAEVQVDTRDVARLHLGDRAAIKLEALPWQQFGLAYGELTALTPDALSDANAREAGEEAASPELKTQAKQSPIHYRARFELRETRFRNLPDGFALRPGMRVVADIKVGRRAILDYVVNPITRVIDESLREP